MSSLLSYNNDYLDEMLTKFVLGDDNNTTTLSSLKSRRTCGRVLCDGEIIVYCQQCCVYFNILFSLFRKMLLVFTVLIVLKLKSMKDIHIFIAVHTMENVIVEMKNLS